MVDAITVERGIAPEHPAREAMPGGIALSAVLHGLVIAAIVLGLPRLFPPPPPVPSPIAVELVTIAPHTRATHPNPHRPVPGAKPVLAVAPPAPKPAVKPAPKPAPPPPAPTASAPPPPPPPPKPEAAKPAPPPKPVAAPVPKPPPPPKPHLARIPKPPPPKPEPKRHHETKLASLAPHHAHKPEHKPAREADHMADHKAEHKAERRRERPKEDTAAFDKLIRNLQQRRPERHHETADFDALLKNLTRAQMAQADETPSRQDRVSAAAAAPSSQPQAPLGSQLTASERDLIIQQIERCWNVPAGARDAKDLVVEIKAVVNPDGTVRTARIVDTARYASDPFFRAAADSAKRAVLNPQCSPLKVPPDKYEAWHNLDLFFNPKDVL